MKLPRLINAPWNITEQNLAPASPGYVIHCRTRKRTVGLSRRQHSGAAKPENPARLLAGHSGTKYAKLLGGRLKPLVRFRITIDECEYKLQSAWYTVHYKHSCTHPGFITLKSKKGASVVKRQAVEFVFKINEKLPLPSKSNGKPALLISYRWLLTNCNKNGCIAPKNQNISFLMQKTNQGNLFMKPISSDEN